MSARLSTSSTVPASFTMARRCLQVLPRRWSPTRRSGASTSARASRSKRTLVRGARSQPFNPPNPATGSDIPAGAGDQASPPPQPLVLPPQLAQAIKLVQLSNLELETYKAEELAKNPLLEARSGDDET